VASANQDNPVKEIIGTFQKQVWLGDEQKESTVVGLTTFDATHDILALDLEHIRTLKDCDPSTDNIGLRYIEHDGPFDVFIT
jgi:hypothetical protein